MKARILLCFWLIVLSNSLSGQECNSYSVGHPHHRNLLQVELRNNIGGFLNNLVNPYIDPEMEPILASQFWLSALDENQNIHLTINGLSFPYNWLVSGPHPRGNELDSLTCENFHKIFTVSRLQIEQHLADLADNGQIDQPISDVMGWPAQNNPHFEAIHGFSLPDAPQGFAPFHDANNDGIYNGEDGDFPLPKSVSPDRIPEEIAWWIANDRGNSNEAIRLDVEVQGTFWSFLCTEESPLNQTLFGSFKVINYSDHHYTNFRIGNYTRFELGCGSDDYAACLPTHNSYYVYNSSEADEVDCIPIVNGPQNHDRLPTASITFLNQELAGFTNINSSSQSNVITTYPATPLEFYHFMNSKWRDGSPMTLGEDGTNIMNPPTSLLFPGLPTEPNEWSMLQASLPLIRRNVLGILHFDHFNKEDMVDIDMAFSTHYRFDLDHFDQIAPMISDIEALQMEYDNQFDSPCSLFIPCETDCVWAGDANNDGIANYKDLLAIGLAYGAEGPKRFGPLAWNPITSNNWNDTFINGVNFKHADCNGNGKIDEYDFWGPGLSFYNSEKPNYVDSCTYSEGNQLLIFDLLSTGGIDTIQAGDGNLLYSIFPNYGGELYGLAFELEYDTAYFEYIRIFSAPANIWIDPDEDNSIQYLRNTVDFPDNQTLKFANTRIDGENASLNGPILIIQMKAREDLPPPPASNQSVLRFKNVIATLNDGSTVPFGGEDKVFIFDNTTTPTHQVQNTPIEVYPNPATDQVFLDFNNFSTVSVDLLNIDGRLIEQFNTFGQSNVQLDLSHLPRGLYGLKVYGENQVGVFKLILN